MCAFTAAFLLALPVALRAQEDPPSVRRGSPTGSLDRGFTQIAAVRELQDGRVLLTDLMEGLILLADFGSGELTQVGRRGEGPGEYRSPQRLLPFRGDSTLVTHGRGWLVLDGPEIVATLRHDAPVAALLLGSSLVGVDASGRVAGVRGTHWHPSLRSRQHRLADSLIVLVADRDLESLDTIARLAGAGPSGHCVSGGYPILPDEAEGGCSPVFPEEQAVFFQDGWLAVARIDPYQVDWRRPDGGWVRGAVLPRSPVELDADERCAAWRRWPFGGVTEPCAPREISWQEWPETLPPFPPSSGMARMGMTAQFVPSLLGTPEGHLLVRHTPTSRTLGVHTRYDVVDRSGRLSGVLTLAANEAVVGFGTQSVYVIETDAFDLQGLRRYRWSGVGG